MKTEHLLILAAVVYGVYRFNESQQGTTALQRAMTTEANTISSMSGTNFTNSLWDPYSGQPAYMFGTVPVVGGTGLQSNLVPRVGVQVTPSTIFGHM